MQWLGFYALSGVGLVFLVTMVSFATSRDMLFQLLSIASVVAFLVLAIFVLKRAMNQRTWLGMNAWLVAAHLWIAASFLILGGSASGLSAIFLVLEESLTTGYGWMRLISFVVLPAALAYALWKLLARLRQSGSALPGVLGLMVLIGFVVKLAVQIGDQTVGGAISLPLGAYNFPYSSLPDYAALYALFAQWLAFAVMYLSYQRQTGSR